MTGPRVAVVLGAAVWPGGVPSPTLRLRVAHAVGLWRAGRVDLLLLTGGVGRHPPAEARVAARLAREAGVPEAALILERRSRSTVENLAFARRLVPPGARVVLVTSRWHLPRAWLAARLVGLRCAGSGARGTLGPLPLLRAAGREAAALPRTAWLARAVGRRPRRPPRGLRPERSSSGR